MAITTNDAVLSEMVWPVEGSQIWIKRAVLVVCGVMLLWAASTACRANGLPNCRKQKARKNDFHHITHKEGHQTPSECL